MVLHARLLASLSRTRPAARVQFFPSRVINALAGPITQAAVIARGLVRR